MSKKLQAVAERARDPNARFNSLAHLVDVEALKRAYGRIRANAAVGVDGIDKASYGKDLEAKLQDLHGRLKSNRYRHQPIRRVHIPKGVGRKPGKTRPIGISTIEDKLVQSALNEVLGAIYEPIFHDGSCGFRPGRSPHDAIRMVDRMTLREGVEWILETDIQAFFDSLDRNKLREMLQLRVADGSLMRLIGKCLHVGVLDGESYARPDEGTVQGSVISPLLGNVYLHYALDEWFEHQVRPTLKGHARLIRYADDLVIGFRHKDEAEKVLEMMRKRMAEYGLTLHPDKTRIVRFGRPGSHEPKADTETFEFLGFTMYWRKSRKGMWVVGMRTRQASFRAAVSTASEGCRRQRHQSLEEQHATLASRLRGHYNYFGVNGNIASLHRFFDHVVRAWYKWLRRRSQRTTLTWERFGNYLKAFPLPKPRIVVRIWG